MDVFGIEDVTKAALRRRCWHIASSAAGRAIFQGGGANAAGTTDDVGLTSREEGVSCLTDYVRRVIPRREVGCRQGIIDAEVRRNRGNPKGLGSLPNQRVSLTAAPFAVICARIECVGDPRDDMGGPSMIIVFKAQAAALCAASRFSKRFFAEAVTIRE